MFPGGRLTLVHRLVQKFVMQPHIPVETATRVYRRYLRLEPTHTEEYIAYLKAKVGPSPSQM